MSPKAPAVPPRLVPKLAETLQTYTRGAFGADLIAGLTVGLVALPLAMAFAIASGVKPEAGIYTAIVGGLVVSALGGSAARLPARPARSSSSSPASWRSSACRDS